MERVAGDVEATHLGVLDLNAFFIGSGLKCAAHLGPGFDGRRIDQFNRRLTIDERASAPVLRDVVEQAMLYERCVLAPRSWRSWQNFNAGDVLQQNAAEGANTLKPARHVPA